MAGLFTGHTIHTSVQHGKTYGRNPSECSLECCVFYWCLPHTFGNPLSLSSSFYSLCHRTRLPTFGTNAAWTVARWHSLFGHDARTHKSLSSRLQFENAVDGSGLFRYRLFHCWTSCMNMSYVNATPLVIAIVSITLVAAEGSKFQRFVFILLIRRMTL